MKASVVLSIFVLAGATAEPIKPLVVFGDAMGWIRAVQGSAAAQQTIGGRALQATPSTDSCSPSEKQVVTDCESAAEAWFDLTQKNTCDELKYNNRVSGCMLQASCINLAANIPEELKASAKKVGLCVSDRNSNIASQMAVYKSQCPSVDTENIKSFWIKALDAVCGGSSTNIVAIVGISAAVVFVLAVAFCVYKNMKDARAASSESKAGRAVAVGNVA
jgi:hypothetical protein